ncbi:MAG: ribosome silencing factor [Lachnospiraceae bacterium]|nr:ribosome silencing factor [Lachnospiraceae bacterium]
MNKVKTVKDAIEDKKGLDIKVLDLSKVSDITDCFVIASGTNRSQIQALSDGVEEAFAKKQIFHQGIEGYDTANWILLDYGDIVVHIFDKDSRELYDLERIWNDADRVEA